MARRSLAAASLLALTLAAACAGGTESLPAAAPPPGGDPAVLPARPESGGVPPSGAPAGGSAAVAPGGRFTDVAREVGIDFDHFTGASGRFYFPEIMGPGAALLDHDGDGDLDVFLVQGALLGPDVAYEDATFPYRGPRPPRSRLFRNDLLGSGGRRGPLRFTDVTEPSGAGISVYGMGAATGDYDNDGDPDLYVTAFGPDVLLRNEGDGTFKDLTRETGLGDPRWTTSASFLDYDNDGWLDLFVTAYCDFTLTTNKECFSKSGARDYCNPKAYPPIPGRLWRNLEGWRFQDVSAAAGVDLAYGHGLGVVAADFDGNGWPDVFVANDGDANQLWMNDRGRFTDAAFLSGVALNMHGATEAGMGIAAADHDDDGDLDLLVTHLNGETNTLFENLGGGQFEDSTARHGVGLPSLPFTGFGVGWHDLDHDGRLDLFIANGDVRRIESLSGDPYPYHQTNQLMMSAGGGRYEDRSDRGGAAMRLPAVGRGAAFGDLDEDGDVDVLVSNNNGPARLLRNDLERKGGWMLVRVIDVARRRDAIGAAVRVALSDGRVLTRHVRADGSYLSAADPRVHLAWPEGVMARAVEVVGTDGRVRPVSGLAPGRSWTVLLDGARAEVAP